MLVQLCPHPDTPCVALSAIAVEVERDGPLLRLRYRAIGRIADVLVPAPAYPERADELWKHTCFEAFVRGGGEDYCEFNLSPSSRWAGYAFDGYRAGMRALQIGAISIETEADEDWYELAATVPPAESGRWRVALTAVIEETNGTKSYWALKHPPGKPDFHHADGFVLELP